MGNHLEVKVCVGSSCHLKGGTATLKAFQNIIKSMRLEEAIDLKADLCLDNCVEAPNVVVGGEIFGGVTPEKADAFFAEHIRPLVKP